MSLDRSRFEAVNGFSPHYFLYYEDVDLGSRLARRFPDMEAVVVETPPGHHKVGASDSSADARRSPAEGYRLTSAITYAREHTSVTWRLCAASLEARDRWRNR
jgi:GT2 family glycosyltransferase